jgi:hypothetical protein
MLNKFKKNTFVTYKVKSKDPSGFIDKPMNFILANEKLEKGKISLMRNKAYTIIADEISDIGKYEFIIDFFDNGIYFKTINMGFEITK